MAQLEVEGTVAGSIASHGTEDLARAHLLTAAHRDTGEVAIDRDVGTVAHDDVAHTAHGEDGRDLAIEDAARLRT